MTHRITIQRVGSLAATGSGGGFDRAEYVPGSDNLAIYKTHTPSERIEIERADVEDLFTLVDLIREAHRKAGL